MKYIVELQPGVWLAPWDGDPGRTLDFSSALRLGSYNSAARVLANARRYNRFVNAKIVEVES